MTRLRKNQCLNENHRRSGRSTVYGTGMPIELVRNETNVSKSKPRERSLPDTREYSTEIVRRNALKQKNHLKA